MMIYSVDQAMFYSRSCLFALSFLKPPSFLSSRAENENFCLKCKLTESALYIFISITSFPLIDIFFRYVSKTPTNIEEFAESKKQKPKFANMPQENSLWQKKRCQKVVFIQICPLWYTLYFLCTQ